LVLLLAALMSATCAEWLAAILLSIAWLSLQSLSATPCLPSSHLSLPPSYLLSSLSSAYSLRLHGDSRRNTNWRKWSVQTALEHLCQSQGHTVIIGQPTMLMMCMQHWLHKLMCCTGLTTKVTCLTRTLSAKRSPKIGSKTQTPIYAGDVLSGSSSSHSLKRCAEPAPAMCSKCMKRPRVVEQVATVSVCLSSDSAYSQDNMPMGDQADHVLLHGLDTDQINHEYVSSPNTLSSHADQHCTGTTPDTALPSLYVRTPLSIYIACTLSHNNFIYICACIIWPTPSALSVKKNTKTMPARLPCYLTLEQIVISLTDVTALSITLSKNILKYFIPQI
jgi:hypothetical protein